MIQEVFGVRPNTPSINGFVPIDPPELEDSVEATETRETITPEIAAEWLTRNINNRPMARNRVATMVRDMLAGRWKPGVARIVLGRDNILCNGQKCLTACVESGVPIVCLVTRDPNMKGPLDWMGDTGCQGRSDSYQLGITTHVRAGCLLIAEHVIAKQPSIAEIESLAPAVTAAYVRLNGSAVKGLSSTPIRVAACTQMRLRPDKAESIIDLYAAFLNGDVDVLTQTAMGLRDAILNGRIGARDGQQRIELLIKALVAFDPEHDGSKSRIPIRSFQPRLDEMRKLLAKAWITG